MLDLLINLTPHDIVVRREDGTDVTVPPSGTVARVVGATRQVRSFGGVPVKVDEPGRVEGLPAPQAPLWDGYSEPPPGYDPTPAPGPVYLVSGMVLSALREAKSTRDDVFAPGTGPADGAIRNERGHIVAATCLKGLI